MLHEDTPAEFCKIGIHHGLFGADTTKGGKSGVVEIEVQVSRGIHLSLNSAYFEIAFKSSCLPPCETSFESSRDVLLP